MTSTFDLLFSEPCKLDFLNKEFDFKIDPDHFIKWLEAEGEDITGEYQHDVSSMCEYSCLYIAMLLYDKKLQSTPKIQYGKFGFWEHYWIEYTFDGVNYFIDLTLQQFREDAPKLAITKASNERFANGYSYLSEGTPISEYLEEKRAFEFYVNPQTMEKPKNNSNKSPFDFVI